MLCCVFVGVFRFVLRCLVVFVLIVLVCSFVFRVYCCRIHISVCCFMGVSVFLMCCYHSSFISVLVFVSFLLFPHLFVCCSFVSSCVPFVVLFVSYVFDSLVFF